MGGEFRQILCKSVKGHSQRAGEKVHKVTRLRKWKRSEKTDLKFGQCDRREGGDKVEA